MATKAFAGQGVASNEEMAVLKRENPRLKKEREFFYEKRKRYRSTGELAGFDLFGMSLRR